MDVTLITEWLKFTIPGIIVLGAIGSIIAASIIWGVNRFLLPILTNLRHSVLRWFVMLFVGPGIKQFVRLHFIEGGNKAQVFYTLQIMRLAFSLFIATCAFIVFAIAIFQEEEALLRGTVLAPLVISFLGV